MPFVIIIIVFLLIQIKKPLPLYKYQRQKVYSAVPLCLDITVQLQSSTIMLYLYNGRTRNHLLGFGLTLHGALQLYTNIKLSQPGSFSLDALYNLLSHFIAFNSYCFALISLYYFIMLKSIYIFKNFYLQNTCLPIFFITGLDQIHLLVVFAGL